MSYKKGLKKSSQDGWPHKNYAQSIGNRGTTQNLIMAFVNTLEEEPDFY